MRKRERLVFLFCLSLVFLISSSSAYYFYDDFHSYPSGSNNLSPNWIPQYPQRVNISTIGVSKVLVMDTYTKFKGDRDNHILLNNSQKNLANSTKISANWSFSVDSCNSSWKREFGVSPQGSSVYFYYNNPQNFLSVEFKVFANTTDCGSGLAQISAFKRVNGTSSPLIPYSTYNFSLNKIYSPTVMLINSNSTYYFLISISNTRIISSNVTKNEVMNGSFLLENSGVIGKFYSVEVNSSSYETPSKRKKNPKPIIHR